MCQFSSPVKQAFHRIPAVPVSGFDRLRNKNKNWQQRSSLPLTNLPIRRNYIKFNRQKWYHHSSFSIIRLFLPNSGRILPALTEKRKIKNCPQFGRAMAWWSRGPWFNPHWEQFYFALLRQCWQDSARICQKMTKYRKTRISSSSGVRSTGLIDIWQLCVKIWDWTSCQISNFLQQSQEHSFVFEQLASKSSRSILAQSFLIYLLGLFYRAFNCLFLYS